MTRLEAALQILLARGSVGCNEKMWKQEVAWALQRAEILAEADDNFVLCPHEATMYTDVVYKSRDGARTERRTSCLECGLSLRSETVEPRVKKPKLAEVSKLEPEGK